MAQQGDLLCCIIFKIALGKGIRASGINIRGAFFQRSIQIPACADDFDFVERARRSVVEAVTALLAAANKIGFTINANITVKILI